jgi:hypothetical protein
LSITSDFQIKLLGLSQANAAALIEVRENAASAGSVSKLSTEVSEIHQALSASMTTLGGDIQASIHQAFTELKSQTATKYDLLTLAEKLDQATLSLESEIKALLDIEPITRRFLTADQGISGLREEASNVASTITVMASQLESLGQSLADVKSKLPAATEILKMLDRLETLAVDMAVVKSATVDRLWIMQEKLRKLARAMEHQEGTSDGRSIKENLKTLLILMTLPVTSSDNPESIKRSLGDSHNDADASTQKVVVGCLSGHGICATQGLQAQAIAETVVPQPEKYMETGTSCDLKIGSPLSLKKNGSYQSTGIRPELVIQGGSGRQYHTPETLHLSGIEDPETYWRASKEPIIPLVAIDEISDAMNCVSPITQERQQLSSNSRTSSTSSFTSVSSIESIFSLVSSSSMSSVASHHGMDTFVRLLTEDSIIMPLCNEAMAIYGHERFERNLRRLLWAFARDLQSESESASQKIAAGFIRSQARKTARIVGQSVAYMDKEGSPRGSGVPTKPSRTFTWHASLPSDEVASDDSESDDDFNIGSSEFEQLEGYIIASKAFQKLRENLRLLVYSNNKNVTAREHTTATIPTTSLNSDLCTILEDCSSQNPSIIEPSITKSEETQEKSSSRINECEAALALEVRPDADRGSQKIGFTRVKDVLCAIARPVCQTYRIWLPAVIGGWLGYMLHEFRNGEQRKESLISRDAA